MLCLTGYRARTKIQWALEGQGNSKSSSPSREDTIRLRKSLVTQPRNNYVGKTHHVNSQRYTNQKICSSSQLINIGSEMCCGIDPPRSQCPLNIVVLVGDMNLVSCMV